MADRESPLDAAHIGYFVPLTKIADFLRAGVEVKVLLAGESYYMPESHTRHAFADASHDSVTQLVLSRRPRFLG